MRVLIYEDGLGDNTMCVYETDSKDIATYAAEAYNGQRIDDIVFDKDEAQCELKIDFSGKAIHLDSGEEIPFDIAINANDIEQEEVP